MLRSLTTNRPLSRRADSPPMWNSRLRNAAPRCSAWPRSHGPRSTLKRVTSTTARTTAADARTRRTNRRRRGKRRRGTSGDASGDASGGSREGSAGSTVTRRTLVPGRPPLTVAETPRFTGQSGSLRGRARAAALNQPGRVTTIGPHRARREFRAPCPAHRDRPAHRRQAGALAVDRRRRTGGAGAGAAPRLPLLPAGPGLRLARRRRLPRQRGAAGRSPASSAGPTTRWPIRGAAASTRSRRSSRSTSPRSRGSRAIRSTPSSGSRC